MVLWNPTASFLATWGMDDTEVRINLYSAGGGKYHRQERRHSEAISGRGKKDNISLKTTILGQLLISLLSLLTSTTQSGAKINISDGSCPERIVTVSDNLISIIYQLNDNLISIMYQLNHSILFIL